ncbi:MAG: decaprenyl-phosphate phosphoribosyltransferase [Chloroflexi bacterium]|nr:decaprenyl-phosphate phosphoribosyltransferase [Chloroflexota bacterium]
MGSSAAKYLLISLRPRQWTKNAAIFIGLVFSLNLRRTDMVVTTMAAFVIFCLLSGAVYLINDLVDCERDRLHPIKCRRPLASGVLPRPLAAITAGFIPLVTLPAAFQLSPTFGLAAAAYLLLNLVYCFSFKNIVIIDVFSIAAGFMLRVVAGAVVIAVPISPWLYVCTILGALFLGFSKRRHELVLLNDGAVDHRSILEEYSPALLDQMTTIVTSSLIMAYSLYTFSAENLPKNHAMMLTIPFALYGIFRYLYLIHRKEEGGRPEEVLLGDWPIIFDIVGWAGTAVAVLYFFRD